MEPDRLPRFGATSFDQRGYFNFSLRLKTTKNQSVTLPANIDGPVNPVSGSNSQRYIPPTDRARPNLIKPGESIQFRDLKKFEHRFDLFGFNIKIFQQTSHFPYAIVNAAIKIYNLAHFEIPSRVHELQTASDLESFFSTKPPFIYPFKFPTERDDLFASLDGGTATAAFVNNIVAESWHKLTKIQFKLLYSSLNTIYEAGKTITHLSQTSCSNLVHLTLHTLHGIASSCDEVMYEKEFTDFLRIPGIFDLLKLIAEMKESPAPVYLQHLVRYISEHYQNKANMALIFESEKPRTFLYLRYSPATNNYSPILSGNFDLSKQLSTDMIEHFKDFFTGSYHSKFYDVQKVRPVERQPQTVCAGTLFWIKYFFCSEETLRKASKTNSCDSLLELYFSILSCIPSMRSFLSIKNQKKCSATKFAACLFKLIKLDFYQKAGGSFEVLPIVAARVCREWPEGCLEIFFLGLISQSYSNFSSNFKLLWAVRSLVETRSNELTINSLNTVETWCSELYKTFAAREDRKEWADNLLEFKKLIEKITLAKKTISTPPQRLPLDSPGPMRRTFAELFTDLPTNNTLKRKLEIHLKKMVRQFKSHAALAVKQLQTERLHWRFDLSSEDFGPLFGDVIESIYHTKKYSNALKLKIIGAIIVYFNIYDSRAEIDKEALDDLKATPAQKITRIYLQSVRKFHPPKEFEGRTIDDRAVQLADFTLLQIKLWELEVLSNNSSGIAHLLQSTPKFSALKPVFLVSQKFRDVHVLAYQAVFHGSEMFSLQPLPLEETQQIFTRSLEKLIERGDGPEYVFSYRDFKQFASWADNQGKEGPLVFPLSLTTSEEMSEDLPETASRHASESNFQTEDDQSVKKTVVLLPLRQKRKRIQDEEEETSFSDFQSADRQPQETQSNLYQFKGLLYSKKRKTNELTAEISDAPFILSSSRKLQIGFATETTADLFTNLSKQTLEGFKASLEKLNSRFSIPCNEEAIPYELSNRVLAYDQEKVATPTIWLDGLLMPYQKEIYIQLNRFFSVGISALLSLEMGMGKTFVSLERVLRHVATDIHKKKIIALPASVILNYYRECLKALSEAKALASATVLKAHPEEISRYLECMPAVLSKFPQDVPNGPITNELTSLLRTYALVHPSLASLQRPHLEQIFHQRGDLTQKLMELACTHLDFLVKFSKANHERFLNLEHQIDNITPSLFSSYSIRIVNSLKSYLKGENLKNPLRNSERVPQKFESEALSTEFIFFIGALLNLKLHPLAEQAIPLEEARRILGYSFASVIVVENSKEMVRVSKQKEPVIVICSHDALRSHTTKQNELNSRSAMCVIDSDRLENLNIGLLVIDEAQRFHGENSKKGQWLTAGVQIMREAGTEVLGITATPFENNFLELVHLVSALNPGTISSDAISFLTKSLRDIPSLFNTTDEVDQDSFILNRFAHFLNLANVLRRVVVTKGTRSLEVLRDWEQLVPQPVTTEYRVPMQTKFPEVFRAIKACEQTIQGSGKKQLLDLYSATKRYLILGQEHYLEKIDVYDPAITNFLRSLDVDPQKLNTVVDRSPYLKELKENPKFIELIRNKKKGILFVENLLLGTLILKLIEQEFSHSCQVRFFNGKLALSEREKVVDWFKNTSRDSYGKLLVLSIDAGGVGLNLPEAESVFMLTLDYNPAKEQQAIRRAIRVGSTGTKDVVSFFFENIYIQEHQSSIVQEKLLWIEFLLSDMPLLKKYEVWHRILQLESVRANLNEHKDPLRAAEHLQKIKSRLAILFFCTKEDDIVKAVEQLKYQPRNDDSEAMQVDTPDIINLDGFVAEALASSASQGSRAASAAGPQQLDTDGMDVDPSENLPISYDESSSSMHSPTSSLGTMAPRIASKERLGLDSFFTIPIGDNRREAEALGAFIAQTQRSSQGTLPENVDRVLAHFLTKSTPMEEELFASLKEEAMFRNTLTSLLNQRKIQIFYFRFIPGFFVESIEAYEKDPGKVSVRILVETYQGASHYSLIIRTGASPNLHPEITHQDYQT